MTDQTGIQTQAQEFSSQDWGALIAVAPSLNKFGQMTLNQIFVQNVLGNKFNQYKTSAMFGAL